MYWGAICTCALHYCAAGAVRGLLRSGTDQRVGVAAVNVLGVNVLGGDVLGSDGLGGDALGVQDVLPWVVGILVVVPLIVPLIVLRLLGVEGLIHHVKSVHWGTFLTCALL